MLSAADVAKCLPMPEAIASLREAFGRLQAGKGRMPQRVQLDVPNDLGITLCMPAFLQLPKAARTAVKVVSVYPENRARQLPVIHGLVLLLEAETGRILAGMAGGAVTAIRTGAVAGLATDFLAPPEANRVAIFGAGVQARTSLEAVCAVREISVAKIYGPTPRNVDAFIAEMSLKLPGVSLQKASSASLAMADCDIVCTATTSATPVFDPRDVKPGMHINAVGVFEPHKQELPTETVVNSRFFVDEIEAALEEAGDWIVPLKAGLVTTKDIAGSLGQLVLGENPGRRTRNEVTVFKSVGLAIQDVAAADSIYTRALETGTGQEVRL